MDQGVLNGVVASATQAIAQKPKKSEETVLLHLAAGTALIRLGKSQEAMQHFDLLHALDAKERRYSSKRQWGEFARIRSLFSAAPDTDFDTSVGPAPIFVVGLPRSGTTLIEQILSMAPGVHPCGELVTTERLLRELFEGDGPVDPAQAADFAATYREHLPDLPADTDKFIDKMPANFRYVGLLLAAFPSGKIIDVQRDPRDVALSMWTTRFSAKGMNYASTIPAIADQANLYRSYMAHWKAIFPTRILTVSYEDLVSNVEDETQRMAAFCGIDWTSEMQNPERNTNPVTTASVNQVRTGIHQRSVGRWEILGENLDLLISRLDPELWPDVDPDASRGSADAAGPPL